MKRIALFLAIVMLSGLYSCGKKEAVSDVSSAAVSVSSEQQQEENIESGSQIAVENSYDVEIINFDYPDNENIKLTYPMIKNWKNADAQERWNKVFMDCVIPSDNEPLSLSDYASYEVDTQIMEKSDSLLSVLFKGYVYFDGSAHPYGFAYAMNVDMQTGESYEAKEFSDSEIGKIADALLDGKYTVKTEYKEVQLSDIFFDFDGEKDTVIGQLKGLYSNENESVYAYFKGDKVGLIFEVNHALGDYAILEVDR